MSGMQTPPFLQSGDCIGIVATARKVNHHEIEPAIHIFEKQGFKVKTGRHLFASFNQYAGTDEERADDFQSMLNDPEVKAIVCARGGYGTVRIIDRLDFSKFIQKPKWVVGYSDITALHCHILQNFHIQTLHASMPLNFPQNKIVTPPVQTLLDALCGQPLSYNFHPNKLNKTGTAKGMVVGGNLSVLYSLSGSVSDIQTRDKILFLEDLDEYLYHIDRMMQNLKRSGKLHNLAALIVGGMSDMKDNTVPFGKSAYQIIRESVNEFSYPVIFDFPAGHISTNLAIILGSEMLIEANENQVVCKFI